MKKYYIRIPRWDDKGDYFSFVYDENHRLSEFDTKRQAKKVIKHMGVFKYACYDIILIPQKEK